MPPTIGNNIAVGGNSATSPMSHITTRTRRRTSVSSRYQSTTPSIATRNSRKSTIKNKNNNTEIIPIERRLMRCNVVVVDVLKQNAIADNNDGGKSPVDNSKKKTVTKEVIPTAERFSNVTVRTKPRQRSTKSEDQRHTISVIEEDHHSIIHLDESSECSDSARTARGTKSVSALPPHVPRTTRQTLSKLRADDDVTFKPTDATIAAKRTTRRNSSRADEGSKNLTNSRVASKRKSHTVEPVVSIETGKSPPKKIALEHSTMGANQTVVLPAANPDWSNSDKGAFKVLLVSVKRIAPALAEAAINWLKHSDVKPEAPIIPQRNSSEISHRSNTAISQSTRPLDQPSSTIAKPQILVTSTIVEVPESPPSASVFKAPEKPEASTSNHLAVPGASKTRLNILKKQPPVNKPSFPSRLPLLAEEENEDEDVYEFLSSSQNNNTNNSTKSKQKKAKAKKMAKPKAKPKKASNPFGKSKDLNRVIKNIGGGPVKQSASVNYVVNLELPKTPPVAPGPIVQQPPKSVFDETSIKNPAVLQLKKQTERSHLPSTSTPASKLVPANSVDMFSLVSPQTQPASPWRFQDDKMVIPQSGLVHQTNGSMVQSYESFANENNNNIQDSPRSKQTYVSERRKSNTQRIAVSEEPGTDLVSEQDLREIEQMYNALKATSEMSEKLISAMRKCKSKAATPQQMKDRHRYKANMQQACLKLKQWYDRSMQSFTHSMRIIGNIQRAAACPSPLSHDQQRVVEKFNLSTDRFRSMIDDMQSAINDSDLENRPPVPAISSSIVKANPTIDDAPKDVLILPERGVNAHRNPLMPLNFVPLPQRDSPLMSPLAKDFTSTSTAMEKTPLAAKSFRRGELQYDKENESFITNRETSKQRGDANGDTASVMEILDETAGNASIVHKINSPAEVASGGMQNNSKNGSKDNYFGFDDDDDEVIENSVPQITLPMPLDISYDTLQRRLKNMNTLLPRRPIFRQHQQPTNTRSSGPTRFPPVKPPRVISSPTKRPRTLREFVASTPRPPQPLASTTDQTVTNATEKASSSAIEALDVSAIAPNNAPKPADANDEPSVVLFDTPEQPSWLNNSAHQRTYTRVPRLRKKKINIYLANLGLDDDDEEDASDEGHELSSDSETDEATKGKPKKKKKQGQKRKQGHKRQPVPVEQTKEFKEFVENFNSMCNDIDRYEMVVE